MVDGGWWWVVMVMVGSDGCMVVISVNMVGLDLVVVVGWYI